MAASLPLEFTAPCVTRANAGGKGAQSHLNLPPQRDNVIVALKFDYTQADIGWREREVSTACALILTCLGIQVTTARLFKTLALIRQALL